MQINEDRYTRFRDLSDRVGAGTPKFLAILVVFGWMRRGLRVLRGDKVSSNTRLHTEGMFRARISKSIGSRQPWICFYSNTK
jgi:hypothetical protein